MSEKSTIKPAFLYGLNVFIGRGGASIFGKQFEDELHPDLKFTGKLLNNLKAYSDIGSFWNIPVHGIEYVTGLFCAFYDILNLEHLKDS